MTIPGTGTYLPPRVNRYVARMSYDANVSLDGQTRIYYGALTAGTNTAVSSAILMVNGSAVTQTYGPNSGIVGGAGAPFGRVLRFAASSTNTRGVTINGVDYLGQPMNETLTLTSGTAIFTKKAYYKVNSIVFATASDTTTVDVGTANRFGVPYALLKGAVEQVSNVVTPFYADPVVVGLHISQTDLLAPTAQRGNSPFRGYVTAIFSNVQAAVTTGGTLQARIGTTVVTGCVVTVANSATAGTTATAAPTDPYSLVIGPVAKAGDVNILPASFATAGAVNCALEITPYGIIPATTGTQTATTYDPRGFYEPSTTPDGSKIFEITGYVDMNNAGGFYGSAHFAG